MIFNSIKRQFYLILSLILVYLICSKVQLIYNYFSQIGFLIIIFKISCLIEQLIQSRNQRSQTIHSNGKAVLITGCDSGFGFKLTIKLNSLGFYVFAGCLDQNGQGAKDLLRQCSSNVEIVQMDVTKDEEINTAFKLIATNLKAHNLSI